MQNDSHLAINGGLPVRQRPMPPRHLVGREEKRMVDQVFAHVIETGEMFRYAGKYEERYQNSFVDFLGGIGSADCVNSGANALFAALGALELEPGSEVIVPAITDAGGLMPILYQLLVPVVSDVDARSYNISADQVALLITPRTKAIIVSHIAGEPAVIDAIADLAQKNNLVLIEDCSQSHGAEYDGAKVGTFGDIAVFSTMATKHHCTGGQGGVIFSKDRTLIEKAKQTADRGKLYEQGSYTGRNVSLGLNCNLDELSAAIGCAQIKKLPKIISATHWIGETLKESLDQGSDVASVGWQPENSKCVYWFVRIKLALEKISVGKEQFSDALIAEGIPVGNEYRSAPFEQEWLNTPLARSFLGSKRLADLMGTRSALPNVEKALSEHINIFIRESYGKQEIEDILRAIEKVEDAYQN